jgi:hypothetical protein
MSTLALHEMPWRQIWWLDGGSSGSLSSATQAAPLGQQQQPQLAALRADDQKQRMQPLPAHPCLPALCHWRARAAGSGLARL